jgi:hypothetical protein
VINQIEAGLPDIHDEEGASAEEIDRFNGATTWTCPTCTNINEMKIAKCIICKTDKPKIQI